MRTTNLEGDRIAQPASALTAQVVAGVEVPDTTTATKAAADQKVVPVAAPKGEKATSEADPSVAAAVDNVAATCARPCWSCSKSSPATATS